MTVRRPSKPWRVILTGAAGEISETPFTGENKAFAHVRASLQPDSPADTARVECWEDGRWWHFETMHKEDMP